jgi:hypothetical protein
MVVDENIARTIVERLQEEHQTILIAEVARSGPDTQVLEIAKQYSAVLLTDSYLM